MTMLPKKTRKKHGAGHAHPDREEPLMIAMKDLDHSVH